MIIAISGIDGSGKTILATNISRKLGEHGKSRYIYLGDYLFLRWVVKCFHWLVHQLNRGANRDFGVSEQSNPFLGVQNKSWYLKAWLLLVVLDNWFRYTQLFLMSAAGIMVVTDRYFYDRLFGLEYHGYSNNVLSKIYKKLTPKPDLLILLDAKVKTALERESNGKHTLEFYEILREKYSQISNYESTWMISGDEFDQDEVLSRSLDKVIALRSRYNS